MSTVHSIWVSIHIAVLFLSLFRVYLFLWLISVSFQSLKMTSHLVSFYHSCCCWSSSPICCLNLSCCMPRKKEEAFARLQKKRRPQKSFELVMGIFRSIQTFLSGVKKTLHKLCIFLRKLKKCFLHKLSGTRKRMFKITLSQSIARQKKIWARCATQNHKKIKIITTPSKKIIKRLWRV